jgi:hypothetical protein
LWLRVPVPERLVPQWQREPAAQPVPLPERRPEAPLEPVQA